jgi:arginase
MKINLIGVPLFLGCDNKGVDMGPEVLREKNIIEILEKNNHTVYDMGNIYVPQVSSEDKYCSHEKMKYLSQIVQVDTNLAHQVYSSLCSKTFPLVIGGDHSLGLGSICGASKYYENLAVIWVDAHGDINTHETSPSGNIHGMPLAAAMGIGDTSLTNLYYVGDKVKPENVFIIGARDLDEGELKLIEDKKINVYTTEDVKTKGMESILQEIHNTLVTKKIDAVHLSFDIDCLDSKYVPGTGTPVKDGMSVDEVKFLLKFLMKTRLIKSMDFVELNTLLDNTDTTIDLCMDLLDWTSKYL